MSLDVHLEEILPGSFDGEYTCERCGHENKLQAFTDLYSANVTHNLNRMADEAGVYDCCWRPEENGIKKAEQMIAPLEAGIALMRSDPARFEKFNAPNGWGLYEHFLPWLEAYLEACRKYPNAKVRAGR